MQLQEQLQKGTRLSSSFWCKDIVDQNDRHFALGKLDIYQIHITRNQQQLDQGCNPLLELCSNEPEQLAQTERTVPLQETSILCLGGIHHQSFRQS